MKKFEDSEFYKNNSSILLDQNPIDLSELKDLDLKMEEINEEFYQNEINSISSANKILLY